MISRIEAVQKEIADRQEYLAAMRKLMATQNAGYAYTGGNTMSNGGDLSACLPAELEKNGIPVPALALAGYEQAPASNGIPATPHRSCSRCPMARSDTFSTAMCIAPLSPLRRERSCQVPET